MQDIIISIRHAFSRIYAGEKTYELRKNVPNVPKEIRCWIYEPLPVGKITGYFIYGGCHRDEKVRLFNSIGDKFGINFASYLEYYKNNFYANAWVILRPQRVEPFTIKSVGVKKAPQSYMFCDSMIFKEKLIKR